MTDIVLFDTSVLIAGFVVGHPRHKVAAKWLERALTQEISWAVSAHSPDFVMFSGKKNK